MPWFDIAGSVSYDGDLHVAAHEVLAELDDTDGVTVGSKDFRQLIKDKAKEHKVGRKDLRLLVMELLE